MRSALKRSRISKALTDQGIVSSFDEAEARLASVRVAIVLDQTLAETPAGQAAALTAIATAYKCFGSVDFVTDCTIPLLIKLPLGTTLVEAASTLGATVMALVPDHATHVIGIGRVPDVRVWQIHCWWDRWLAGVRTDQVDGLGDSNLPLAGVFAAANAVRQVFAWVLRGSNWRARDVTISLWEPWIEKPTDRGPRRFDVPNRLWFLGLGHLGQGFIWNLGFLQLNSERYAVLQDDQSIAVENEATSMLVTGREVGMRKTRVAARWLESVGWKTELIERRHTGDIVPTISDPAYALCGFDDVDPRFRIAAVGFTYMIDAGIGHGPIDFEGIQLRILPKGTDPNFHWVKSNDAGRRESDRIKRLQKASAYTELDKRGDSCGSFTLAQASVSVPFVGSAAGALAIAQAIRLASLRPTREILRMELGSPEYVSSGGEIPAPAAGLGAESIWLPEH